MKKINAKSYSLPVSRFLAATFLSLTLVACGGSSSSESTPIEGDDPIITDPDTGTATIDDEFGKWLTDLADNHILPSYQSLHDNATELSNQAATFCANSSSEALELTSLQDTWRNVMLSWQTIQWLKVGPILEESRLYRIHYWPDSKDTVSSGIATLLASSEQITEEYISTRSVGSQGLPAIEQLLFPESNQDSLINADDANKRCELLTAISANVATISNEVNNQWQIDGGNYYAQLTQGTDDFTSKKDAVEELVTNWLEQLERVKDEKMLTPLGSESPGLPDEAEHVLSDHSVTSIQQNIAIFKVIYTAGNGHGFDDILIDFLSQQNIATEMTAAIDDAINNADALTGSYETLLATDTGRVQISETIDALRNVRDILTVDLVQATDIDIGFNSNDGD